MIESDSNKTRDNEFFVLGREFVNISRDSGILSDDSSYAKVRETENGICIHRQ